MDAKVTSLFNFTNFDIKLETDVIGRNFLYFNEVTSTNTVLKDMNATAPNGSIVFSELQTAGKGRFDNRWESGAEQNLTFSILLNIDKTLRNKLNVLNLGTSLAIATTIENLFQLQSSVKWPNDVLIKEHKVGGILLETISVGAKIKKAITGVGININQVHFEGDFNYPPTSLKLELGQDVEREKVMADFLNNFEELVKKLKVNPDGILQSWRDKCRMIGERISLNQNGKLRYGTFEDIDEEGQMLFKSDGAVEVVNYGAVSILK